MFKLVLEKAEEPEIKLPIALTRWTFFGKVMPLLFNMLSRLVINNRVGM